MRYRLNSDNSKHTSFSLVCETSLTSLALNRQMCNFTARVWMLARIHTDFVVSHTSMWPKVSSPKSFLLSFIMSFFTIKIRIRPYKLVKQVHSHSLCLSWLCNQKSPSDVLLAAVTQTEYPSQLTVMVLHHGGGSVSSSGTVPKLTATRETPSPTL